MIRVANYNDLFAINEIYNQAIDTKSSTADLVHISITERIKWFDEHSDSKYPVFVYQIDDKVVGWMSVSPYRKGRKALDSVVEVSYYLDKNYQRRGIGSNFIEYILNKSSKYSFKFIICIILEINTGSIKLLEKFGFERWAYLPQIGKFVVRYIMELM
jgi:phosphinothricin acetyltransferase